MIFKIYIATVIITILADLISTIKAQSLLKIYGYKAYKRSVVDRLNSLLLTAIVIALPVINIIMAIAILALSDDMRLKLYENSDNYYKVKNND